MIFFLILADAVSPHGNESVLWGIESQAADNPQAVCIYLEMLV